MYLLGVLSIVSYLLGVLSQKMALKHYVLELFSSKSKFFGAKNTVYNHLVERIPPNNY